MNMRTFCNSRLRLAATVLCAALALAACDTGNSPGTGSGDGPDPLPPGMNYLADTTAARESPILVGAEQDSSNKEVIHFIYYCGEIKNAFVQTLTTPLYNDGKGSVSMSTSTITATTVAQGVSHSVTNSEERKSEHSFKIPIPNIGEVYSYTWGYSKETSETTQQISYQAVEKTIQQTTTYTADMSIYKTGLYYAYAAYADLDIYLDVALNMETNVYTSSEISYGPRNVKLRFVSTEDQAFSIPQDDRYTVAVPAELLFTDIFPMGNGTAESPYEVSRAAQFIAIKAWPDKQYKLTQNIDLKGFDSTAPKYAYTFSGVFDGNGKTINGFKVAKTIMEVTDVTKKNDQYFGLFSQLSGTVKNLTFEGASIQLANGTGYPNGALLPLSSAELIKIHAGLVCGRSNAGSRIENVTLNDCEVVAHANFARAGGIAGTAAAGTVAGCTAKGLNLVSYGDGGGIAGYLGAAKIDNCLVDRTNTRKSKLVSRAEVVFFGLSGLTTTVYSSPNTGGITGYMENAAAAAVTNCTVRNTEFIETAQNLSKIDTFLDYRRDGNDKETSLLGGNSAYYRAGSFGYIVGWQLTNASGVSSSSITGNSQSGNSLDLVFNEDVNEGNKTDRVNKMQQDDGSIKPTTYNTAFQTRNDNGNVGYCGPNYAHSRF